MFKPAVPTPGQRSILDHTPLFRPAPAAREDSDSSSDVDIPVQRPRSQIQPEADGKRKKKRRKTMGGESSRRESRVPTEERRDGEGRAGHSRNGHRSSQAEPSRRATLGHTLTSSISKSSSVNAAAGPNKAMPMAPPAIPAQPVRSASQNAEAGPSRQPPTLLDRRPSYGTSNNHPSSQSRPHVSYKRPRPTLSPPSSQPRHHRFGGPSVGTMVSPPHKKTKTTAPTGRPRGAPRLSQGSGRFEEPITLLSDDEEAGAVDTAVPASQPKPDIQSSQPAEPVLAVLKTSQPSPVQTAPNTTTSASPPASAPPPPAPRQIPTVAPASSVHAPSSAAAFFRPPARPVAAPTTLAKAISRPLSTPKSTPTPAAFASFGPSGLPDLGALLAQSARLLHQPQAGPSDADVFSADYRPNPAAAASAAETRAREAEIEQEEEEAVGRFLEDDPDLPEQGDVAPPVASSESLVKRAAELLASLIPRPSAVSAGSASQSASAGPSAPAHLARSPPPPRVPSSEQIAQAETNRQAAAAEQRRRDAELEAEAAAEREDQRRQAASQEIAEEEAEQSKSQDEAAERDSGRLARAEAIRITFEEMREEERALAFAREAERRDEEEKVRVIEAERKKEERKEKERVERERMERVRVETERVERQRVEKEKVEKERVEREKAEKERADREAAYEKGRLERVEEERLRKLRIWNEKAAAGNQARLDQIDAERREADARRALENAARKERARRDLEKDRLAREAQANPHKPVADKRAPPALIQAARQSIGSTTAESAHAQTVAADAEERERREARRKDEKRAAFVAEQEKEKKRVKEAAEAEERMRLFRVSEQKSREAEERRSNEEEERQRRGAERARQVSAEEALAKQAETAKGKDGKGKKVGGQRKEKEESKDKGKEKEKEKSVDVALGQRAVDAATAAKLAEAQRCWDLAKAEARKRVGVAAEREAATLKKAEEEAKRVTGIAEAERTSQVLTALQDLMETQYWMEFDRHGGKNWDEATARVAWQRAVADINAWRASHFDLSEAVRSMEAQAIVTANDAMSLIRASVPPGPRRLEAEQRALAEAREFVQRQRATETPEAQKARILDERTAIGPRWARPHHAEVEKLLLTAANRPATKEGLRQRRLMVTEAERAMFRRVIAVQPRAPALGGQPSQGGARPLSSSAGPSSVPAAGPSSASAAGPHERPPSARQVITSALAAHATQSQAPVVGPSRPPSSTQAERAPSAAAPAPSRPSSAQSRSQTTAPAIPPPSSASSHSVLPGRAQRAPSPSTAFGHPSSNAIAPPQSEHSAKITNSQAAAPPPPSSHPPPELSATAQNARIPAQSPLPDTIFDASFDYQGSPDHGDSTVDRDHTLVEQPTTPIAAQRGQKRPAAESSSPEDAPRVRARKRRISFVSDDEDNEPSQRKIVASTTAAQLAAASASQVESETAARRAKLDALAKQRRATQEAIVVSSGEDTENDDEDELVILPASQGTRRSHRSRKGKERANPVIVSDGDDEDDVQPVVPNTQTRVMRKTATPSNSQFQSQHHRSTQSSDPRGGPRISIIPPTQSSHDRSQGSGADGAGGVTQSIIEEEQEESGGANDGQTDVDDEVGLTPGTTPARATRPHPQAAPLRQPRGSSSRTTGQLASPARTASYPAVAQSRQDTDRLLARRSNGGPSQLTESAKRAFDFAAQLPASNRAGTVPADSILRQGVHNTPLRQNLARPPTANILPTPPSSTVAEIPPSAMPLLATTAANDEAAPEASSRPVSPNAEAIAAETAAARRRSARTSGVQRTYSNPYADTQYFEGIIRRGRSPSPAGSGSVARSRTSSGTRPARLDRPVTSNTGAGPSLHAGPSSIAGPSSKAGPSSTAGPSSASRTSPQPLSLGSGAVPAKSGACDGDLLRQYGFFCPTMEGRRDNKWTAWSNDIVPGTLHDLMYEIDKLFLPDGRQRPLMKRMDEEIVWGDMRDISDRRRFLFCAWNRWRLEKGAMRADDNERYLQGFVEKYGSLLRFGGVDQEARDTFHILYKHGLIDLGTYTKACSYWNRRMRCYRSLKDQALPLDDDESDAEELWERGVIRMREFEAGGREYDEMLERKRARAEGRAPILAEEKFSFGRSS